MTEVAQQYHIQAPPELIHEAFTRASELREWLCDQAYSDARPQGRYWLRWRDGSKVEGQYIHISPFTKISFLWRAEGAPGETTVTVSLEPSGNGTEVRLTHSGFGSGPDWRVIREQTEKQWSQALGNLKSVLEDGIDLRRVQRPYLGVQWRFAEAGGIQVTGVVSEHGADASALLPGDVLLAIGDSPVADYTGLVEALESCVAGDCVDVSLLRDGQEMKATVRLGAAPRSELALEARSILAGVRDRQIRAQRLLSDTLLGTTEWEASKRPSPDGWSVKEILAHLSVTERNLHHRLCQIAIRGWDDTPKGDPTNLPEAIAAAMARTDTLPKLLDRFAQDQAETLAFFTALRPTILARKARYRRLAEALDLSAHTREHIEQIAAVLNTIRAHSAGNEQHEPKAVQ